MATKISEQELANLAINLVKSPSAFQQMQQNNQIQPDEFYLVEGDDAATYTFQDFTNGRFIVNQTKNGVITPMTINTGSITGGEAITSDTTVIGGIVPTGIQGYELSALKKTITGQNGVVVTASGTGSIVVALSAVAGLTAGSVGPTSAISPGHGDTVSIPYITYDVYGRVTSATNRTLTFPTETQLSAAVPDGITAYNVGQANDFYVVGGLTTSNHKITVVKKKLSAGAAMTIATASNEIVIAHSDTSTVRAGAHNAGSGAFIRSISVDEYGHITALSAANETAETQLSGGSGEENLKVITGISVNNHEINVAKRTLSATGALSIASGTGTFNITHNQSVLAASTYTAGNKAFIKSITVDSYGHITGYAFGDESASPNISIDSNASDPNNPTLIAGLTAENHLIKVARKTISAGTGIAVSNTSAAITISLASGVSSTATSTSGLSHGGTVVIASPTVDTYGRVTKITNVTYTLPSESGLSGGSASGDDFNVVTGVTGSGHSLSVAKKTLTGGTGITLSKSSTALTIALSTLNSAGSYGPGSGVSAASSAPTAVNFGGNVLVPYVTVDSYGRVSAASTKYYKLPTIGLSDDAGTTASSAAVIAGLTLSGTNAVTISPAKKTITAGSGMVVSANSAAITVGIQSLTVSASTAASTLTHGGTVALPSSITVNNLGQVTAIKTTTYTMPSETALSIGNNAGATNCELINSITVNGHAITLTKSKIVAGTAITVASQDSNGNNQIKISHGSTNAASSLTPAADTFINGLTLDSFGHVTGISTAVESTGASLSVSSNAGDDGYVVVGMTLGGDHNHEISLVKRKISAGSAISVSTSTPGEIIVSHSDTSNATSITSSAGNFVSAISVDGYGHVRSMSTTSETVLAGSAAPGTIGTEDNKVITGLQVSGHTIGAAKKTLEGLNGITITNATDKLSIGLSTTVTAVVASNYYGATGATSGVSSNKTLSYSNEANRTFYVPYIKVNDRGRVVAIGTNSVVIPASVSISAANDSGATADTTVVGGISASNSTVSVAKKTLSGTNGISVTASSNTGISIGISTISVGVTSGIINNLSHGNTITVVSSVSVNTLGQTTAVKNVQLTLPSETSLSWESGTTAGEENLKIITGLALSGTANHTLEVVKRTVTPGSAITVSTAANGILNIAHSGTSSQSSVNYTNGNFVSVVSLDAMGHVTKLSSAAETSLSLSTINDNAGGNVNLKFVTGLTLEGTHNHQLKLSRKAIAVNTGALSIAEADGIVTIAHKDTSSQANVTASDRTYVTGVTLDTYGHVTGLSTSTETVVNVDDKTAIAPNTTTNWYKLTAAPMSGATSSVSVSSTVSGVLYNNNISMQMSTGTLRANIFRVQDKVELKYNSTTDALDFIFI